MPSWSAKAFKLVPGSFVLFSLRFFFSFQVLNILFSLGPKGQSILRSFRTHNYVAERSTPDEGRLIVTD